MVIPPVHPDWCRLPPEAGLCSGYEPRWYYDNTTMTCRRFKYGGCDGNNNRFLTESLCMSTCNRPGYVSLTPTPGYDSGYDHSGMLYAEICIDKINIGG